MPVQARDGDVLVPRERPLPRARTTIAAVDSSGRDGDVPVPCRARDLPVARQPALPSARSMRPEKASEMTDQALVDVMIEAAGAAKASP